ncbi:MAG: GNAT family N-acetyltransferase [Bacteroidales bacterium]|nr:GNAT family N-acetyltransferase [Bacteroidales bacterium]MBK7172703.1 GNAT family N-acetyltransferase [Bacteroidales bacterium]
MHNYCKPLDWDTTFFGYKIGSILADQLTPAVLSSIIKEMRIQNYKLAYGFAKPEDVISNGAFAEYSAFLADEKVTFQRNLKEDDNFSFVSSVKEYLSPEPSEKLRKLALQSGIYSRFKIDPNFIHEEYGKLYNEWIEKSVNKTLAKIVLAYFIEEDEKGFITLNMKNNVGSIGLIAVDENARGLSIGRELTNASLHYFKEAGMESVEVVTQKSNEVACKFYTSLGFSIKDIVNVYHLWIR